MSSKRLQLLGGPLDGLNVSIGGVPIHENERFTLMRRTVPFTVRDLEGHFWDVGGNDVVCYRAEKNAKARWCQTIQV